jgi:signal transduction histidine kinase
MASITQDFGSILNLLEKQEYSSKIIENLINDLLDLAKIENGKFRLYEEFFNLPNTIVQTFEIMLFWAN